MKARVSHLHKTAVEWAKYKDWVPEAGEFIIYDPDERYSYARVKVGDGKRTLSELDFFVDSAAIASMKQQHFFEILDGGRISPKK
jgi:hypothetical protein